jgi:8-oxo-dGTP diphosphatase
MKRILVAAAVIRREGKILIAQRPLDKHQGGLWEFPGGKVEEGEPVQQALVRELEEELGITATASRPLIRITHDYPDKSVCLDVWEVSAFSGEAHGREGQPVRWVFSSELKDYNFPAANQPIIAAACLPSRYLITPDDRNEAGLLQWLEQRLASDARLLLLRAPQLPERRYLALAAEFLQRCSGCNVQLLLHGNPDYLQQVPAHGVHMSSRQLLQLASRPVSPDVWLAASVHDAGEIAQAERIAADFVTLSPVQATASHPSAAALGWEKFATLVQGAPMPVYALGGMSDADIEAAQICGAQGVAGIRGLL